MRKHGKNFTVTTDKSDYAPNSDAVFTASHVDRGSTVEFQVAHVNAGDDGIYGTEDDLYTYDLTGTGITWSVTDGGEDDADGLLNGTVVTSWHVNIDALNQAFIVSAIDVETGTTSTAFFTDAPPDTNLAAVDLTAAGNSGSVNGVVYQAIPTGSGTGNFPAFVQVQNTPSEQGYNTDAAAQFDEGNSAPHNHSILLSNIPIIIGDGTNGTVAGVAYRVFLYDSNESSGSGNEFLSLDKFQLYQANVGNLTNLTPGSGFPGAGDTLIYDLDAGGDKWIALNSSLSSGSGVSDGRVLVPNSLFINDGAHNYVYLYSAFGGQGAAWNTQSGFEEWALGEGATLGSISGTKFKDADGSLATTGDRTPLQNWTIYIDVDGTNTLTANDISTTTDANGKYTFNLLLPSTYTIREVVQTGWHQLSPTGPDEYTIVLAAGANDTDGNDFINAQDTPVLNIVKNASVTGGTANATSDVITYSYTLTNTGNVPISNIVLTDDNGTPGNTTDDFSPSFVGGDTDGDSQLDLTETWTYSRTKAVTQAMLDAGNDIINIVTADDGAGGAAADTDDASVDVVQNKSLNIDKTASVTGGTANATTDVITYSYTLTNTGNAAISNITLTDDNGTPGNTTDDFSPSFVGGDTDGDSKLDVGETWTYSRTKAVTQAMLNAGNDIVNIVTADSPETPADTDDATVDVVQSKTLNVEKTASVTGGTANATTDVITYSYTLTNTGNAEIANVTLTDDNGTPGNTTDDFSPSFVGGDTDGDSKLDVGETWTYSRTKAVTQAMLDAGNDIVNIVTADSPDTPSDTDDATVDVVQSKTLNVEKTASVTGGTANATTDVITYSYTLTNTGNAEIANVTLTDDNGTPGNTTDDFSPSFVGGDTDGDSKLDVGETWTYTRTKAVTQAMLDAGNDIVNIVTADSPETPADTDDATVDVVQSKTLNVEKTASVTGGTANATTDVITYSYTLTNTGNAEIANVTLTDDNGTPGNTTDDFSPSFVGGDTDGDSKLDVGETWTYTRTKAVTQAMLDAGNDIVNIVTADSPETPADTDDATVDVVQSKTLNVEKTASVTGGTANATTDVITYSYTLTNTGNAEIANVTLTDDNGTPGNTTDDFSPSFVGGDTDGDSKLDVGETWTYTRTKAVTQAMLDAGNDIVNIVTADSPETPADTDDATVDVVQSKTLNVEKTAAVTGGTANATTDVITYSYTLTNTGNSEISNVTLTDDNGTPGNTTDDFSPSFVGGDTDGDSKLDLNETWTYTRTKAVTQAMLDAGNDIVNIVTADSPDTPPDTDDATVDVVQSKTLNVEKTASVTGGTANATTDVITYSYTLTNTGNAEIANITLTDDNGTPGNTTDDFSPSFVGGDTDGDSKLDVGETWTYTRTKAVTQAMLNAGNDIINIVTADSPDTPPDTDDATVDVVQSKSLNVEKTASVTGGTANATTDVITYSYTLTNTGNSEISSVTLTDDNGTPGNTTDDFSPSFVGGDTDGDSKLDVGETWTYTRTKAVTQAMLDAGNDIVNIVTADSPETPPDTDDATVDVVQNKSLNIVKNASVTGGTADVTTDVITYSYTLTNTGNTAIGNIVLTDDNGTPGNTSDDFSPSFVGGDTDGDSQLDVGETWSYTATKGVTQGMIDAGNDIVNIVTADDGAGGAPPDTDDAIVDVVRPVGDLDITKTHNIVSKGAHADKVGDIITYQIVVTNTGGSPLTGVVVTDTVDSHAPVQLNSSNSTLLGDVGNDGILGANETWTYVYKYTLTQDDLFNSENNRLFNTATVDTDQTNPESATAVVDLGPGIKTYGQWALSSYQKFWDGIANNETHSQTVTDGFPMSDITRPPYANPDTDGGGADQAGMVLDPVTGTYKLGLLVGDWNLNGETDAGEHTLFYTPAEAVAIMTASSITVNADARYLLARELLGSWLNYQAGNPAVDLNEGGLGDALDAQDVIEWGIAWLQARTPNEVGSTPGEGSLTLNSAAWKILKTSPLWTTGIDGGDANGVVDGVSPMPFFDDPANDGDVPAGATITSYLSEYNNDGTILGVHIALD